MRKRALAWFVATSALVIALSAIWIAERTSVTAFLTGRKAPERRVGRVAPLDDGEASSLAVDDEPVASAAGGGVFPNAEGYGAQPIDRDD